MNEAGEEREVTACEGRDIMKEEEDDGEALRQLADSNVKTMSDGEMMNRERENYSDYGSHFVELEGFFLYTLGFTRSSFNSFSISCV